MAVRDGCSADTDRPSCPTPDRQQPAAAAMLLPQIEKYEERGAPCTSQSQKGGAAARRRSFVLEGLKSERGVIRTDISSIAFYCRAARVRVRACLLFASDFLGTGSAPPRFSEKKSGILGPGTP